MNSSPYIINNNQEGLTESLTTKILAESNPLNFHKSLKAYKETPLVDRKDLAKEFGVKEIYIKDESHRFGLNAFKGLGASFAIYQLLNEDPGIKVFCTATDGNHGRAVAWASALHGKKSYVYVPKGTTVSRIEAIRNEGAVVEEIDGNYEEASTYAREMSEKNNWVLVQDAAWEGYEEIPAYIKAGYLTHFKELENSLHVEDDSKVDFVFLQSGVGSWPAAAAWYYENRYKQNKPKLIVVEPLEAAGLLASFKAGKRISPTGNYTTIMAGLNCGIPSSTAWEILNSTIDATIAIEDTFTEEAMRKLFYAEKAEEKIISGESGAGGFAGFIALMTDPRFADLKNSLNISSDSRILFYNTEGNTDPKGFSRVVEKAK